MTRGEAVRIGKLVAKRTSLQIIHDRDLLLVALEGLVAAVTQEVNEKGGGGFILARLSDARAALAKVKA